MAGKKNYIVPIEDRARLPYDKLPYGTTGCQVPECPSVQHEARGLCRPHYGAWCRGFDPFVYRLQRDRREGHTDPRDGYHVIFRPGHPNASGRGKILEHRWIMAEHLGRPLYPDETVHHKNGVRNDNALTNLILRVGAHPQGLTVEEAVSWAKEILRRYGDKDGQ